MAKVGIVLVSHSEKVANGIKEIIMEVAQEVPVATAGGTDSGEIGTSFVKIVAAIEEACTDKGAIIFYDLGSAMMNAEMAVEQFSEKNVRIAEHIPILEGAYVAAVESSMNKDVEEILSVLKNSFQHSK